MGRVQGGARAAFATLSWGPARMKYYFDLLLGIFYCQLLANPIPMENLILVGRKLLGRNDKSIGFSL